MKRALLPHERTLLALAFAFGVVGCGKDKAKDKADEKDAAPAAAAEEAHAPASVNATVATVATAPFTETIDAIGVVAARAGHVALLSAPAPTRVLKVLVAMGDKVAVDAPLVDLELPAFDAALTSAEAALSVAEKAAARAQRLVDAGVAPRKDAEVAQAELEAARASVLNARRTRDLAHLRTPIAGVITRLNAVIGSNVDQGQPLVEITDASVVDVILNLQPSVAARIRVGQVVALREGDDASSTEAVAKGHIVDVAAILDSATRGVNVRVQIDSKTRTLRPGESLSGTVTIARHASAVVIPDNALVPDADGFRVFVVDSANVAKATTVTVGGRSAHTAWITDGLKGGERIVTNGAFGVDDGAKVVPAKP